MAASRSTSARVPVPKDDLLVPPMAGYPGSKASAGVAERIIRQMPPHVVYLEAFAGRAAVWRKKRPAASSILIDVDAKPCHQLRSYAAALGMRGRAAPPLLFCDNPHYLLNGDGVTLEIVQGDSMEILASIPAMKASDTLALLDPPYLGSVRTKKVLYDYDFTTPRAHSTFLAMAAALPCMVMICGYMSPLYAKKLNRWRLVEIPAMTHGGLRTECVWMNFPEPKILHDPRFAGDGFRERERIKRKRERWAGKFARMDGRERQAIAEALLNVDRPTVEAAMRSSTQGGV